MDIRQITPAYSVTPQIDPADIPAIKEAGFVAIIDNRPDAEIPPEWHTDVMGAAAEAAGLAFTANPVTHAGLNMDMVATQMNAIEAAGGPVLAYCASGTRSSIVWSLGMAGKMPTEEIIKATADAGYDLAGLAPQIDGLASAQ
ncbi:TIGR01244 family phosphatase [Marivivens donghaensis]|uniref:TIGR01244 family phosphatase n=1 Tax=Marivivens donghaensis TaxID=1699413 RepID=A0ABX0W0Q2_9RHOB|nr:TIGR01244 family sulfur transferase [Marivivens donghaensis]NIY73859.1 TIGR01244 family phosphatase [Marivivens donghaensis]